MAEFAPSEETMWDDPEKLSRPRFHDHEIDDKYEEGEQRIVTEVNREKLPNFVQALSKPGYLNLRPFYQRRARWDSKRQSRLIESFIMNIPVPPVFLYEKAYNQYEVMDGQQRISALQAFYENSFKLTGLESWPELNGRIYKTLPSKVRSGLDRRSISSIVLLKESAPNDEAAMTLKRIVFERLNTGGVKLGRQEIRNCLFQGQLNAHLLQWSSYSPFRQAWNIPDLPVAENQEAPSELTENTMYTKMEDVELILRFLALRHSEHFSGAMQSFLDRYMIRSQSFSVPDFVVLEKTFKDTMQLCLDIFQDNVFRAFDPETGQWQKRPHKSLADAEMVAVSRHLTKADELKRKRSLLVKRTESLFRSHPNGTFTGSANTKDDVQNRIRLMEEMVSSCLEG